MGDSDRISRYNAEGYPDETAHDALTAVLREARRQEAADLRSMRLIKALKAVVDAAGFDLIERVAIRDRETGREYR